MRSHLDQGSKLRTLMRLAGLAVGVAAASVALAGCGGDDAQSQEAEPATVASTADATTQVETTESQGTTEAAATEAATSQPEASVEEPQPFPATGTAQPGRYLTTMLQPTLVLDLPEPAIVLGEDISSIALGSTSIPNAYMTIANLDRQQGAVDPKGDGEVRELQPMPDDYIAWIADHPRFDAGQIQDVTVGSFQGRAVDVTVGDGYPVAGCESCVAEFAEAFAFNQLGETDKEREILLDVEGTPILIQLTAPIDQFDAFVAEAAPILASLDADPDARPDEIAGDFTTGWLAPGTHTSDVFDPAFSLNLPEGWVSTADQREFVSLNRDGALFLSLLSGPALQVFDPAAERSATPPTETQDPPGNWVQWLRQHPKLEATEPEAVTLAGHEGVVFDVMVKPGAGAGFCGRACVPLFSTPAQAVVAYEGDLVRTYVLDVDGTDVLVAFGGPEYIFDELAPQADEVLETVSFR